MLFSFFRSLFIFARGNTRKRKKKMRVLPTGGRGHRLLGSLVAECSVALPICRVLNNADALRVFRSGR